MGIFPLDIEPGNKVVHHTFLVADILVFQHIAAKLNNNDHRMFEAIYSFSVVDASKYVGMYPTSKMLIGCLPLVVNLLDER